MLFRLPDNDSDPDTAERRDVGSPAHLCLAGTANTKLVMSCWRTVLANSGKPGALLQLRFRRLLFKDRPFLTGLADDTKDVSKKAWRQRGQRVDGDHRRLNWASHGIGGREDSPAFLAAGEQITQQRNSAED